MQATLINLLHLVVAHFFTTFFKKSILNVVFRCNKPSTIPVSYITNKGQGNGDNKQTT